MSGSQVKSIGCVLVYIDDKGQVQVADEHTIATLPSDAPRPGPPNKRPAAPKPTEKPVTNVTSETTAGQ
ncbi:hypothetical protein BH09SUM1_BH09SUM1_16280 [soil metagenome]